MIILETNDRRLCTMRMNSLIIASVTSKSAITPSRNGLIAVIFPGVRPSICLARLPTGQNPFFAVFLRDRHHGRFVQNDSLIPYIDQRVGRAEVDGHIGRHKPKKF